MQPHPRTGSTKLSKLKDAFVQETESLTREHFAHGALFQVKGVVCDLRVSMTLLLRHELGGCDLEKEKDGSDGLA